METPKPNSLNCRNFIMDEDDMETPRPIHFKPAENKIDEDSAPIPMTEPEKDKLKAPADLTPSSHVVPPTSISSIFKSILQDILVNIGNTCIGVFLTLTHTISLFFFLAFTIFMIWPSYVWDFFVPLKLDDKKKKTSKIMIHRSICASDEVSEFALDATEEDNTGDGDSWTKIVDLIEILQDVYLRSGD